MSKVGSLVVFGSFGFGNVGDEAVPLAIGDLLDDIGCKRELIVVGRFNTVVEPGVLGLGALSANKSKLDGLPVVISGGGIIEPKLSSCIYRYQDYLAEVSPSKTTLLACSFEFGVKYNWRIKRKINAVLSKCSRRYTRDYVSELFFREDFAEHQISTLGDIVLGLKAAESCSVVESCGSERFIAVSLCGVWSKSETWLKWKAKELVKIAKHFKASLVFVPLSCYKSDDDRVIHAQVIEQCKLEDDSVKHYQVDEALPPREVAFVYQNSLLVIAMRLHACVMAYGQETPFVSLAYHPKLLGFSQTVGWREFVVPSSLQQRQDDGAYGYNFESLSIEEGDLYNKAVEAVEYSNFGLLPLLKSKLRKAIAIAVE